MDDFLDKAFLENYLPATTLFAIWCVFVIIILASYAISVRNRDWVKIYDKCQRKDVKYRYLIRMITGPTDKEFIPGETTIKMEIMGPKNKKLTAFGIKSHILERSQPIEERKGDRNEMRFLLYRKQSLNNIVKIIVNHNGSGTFYLFNVEIQEVNSEVANIAHCNQYIEKLTAHDARIKQVFPAADQKRRSMEYSDEMTKLFNFFEYVVFLWFVTNLIPLFSVLLIVCFEQQNGSDKSFTIFCKSYHNDIVSSVMTAVSSSCFSVGITGTLMFIYRFGIKERILESKECKVFEIVFLLLVMVMGSMAGMGSVVILAFRFKEDVVNENYFWIITSIIGYVFLIFVWLPILVLIGWATGFFDVLTVKPVPPDDDSDFKKSSKEVPQQPPKVIPAKPKTPVKVKRKESEESIGKRYYAEIMKNKGKKVKSISKY